MLFYGKSGRFRRYTYGPIFRTVCSAIAPAIFIGLVGLCFHFRDTQRYNGRGSVSEHSESVDIEVVEYFTALVPLNFYLEKAQALAASSEYVSPTPLTNRTLFSDPSVELETAIRGKEREFIAPLPWKRDALEVAMTKYSCADGDDSHSNSEVIPSVRGIDVYLTDMYDKYASELRELSPFIQRYCEEQKKREGGRRCSSYGQLESDITYMRVREFGPRKVLEISPQFGYSSMIILKALERNGQAGELFSYDILNNSQEYRHLLRNKTQARWHFIQGDARTHPSLQIATLDFDYVFIDSEHTKEMSSWYVNKLFSHLSRCRKIHFSIHDMMAPIVSLGSKRNAHLKSCFAGEPRAQFSCLEQNGVNIDHLSPESCPVIQFLASHSTQILDLYHVSYFKNLSLAMLLEKHREALRLEISGRRKYALNIEIHGSKYTVSPSLFFSLRSNSEMTQCM